MQTKTQEKVHIKVKIVKIIDALKKQKIPYQENYPLLKHTTFQVGGPAKIYVLPRSFRELKLLQKIVTQIKTPWLSTKIKEKRNKIPVFFLGGGSNILISDHGFSGVVVHLSSPEEVIIKQQTKEILHVRGRVNSRSAWFAKKVSKMGYTGLEFLSTIPGHLGGAIIQNAGCYGSEMKDYITKIFAVEKGEYKILNVKEADFSYRNSIFKKNPDIWVYAVDFILPVGDIDRITDKLEDFQQRRLNSQPRNRKSAGSVFKNPDKKLTSLKAWQLIQQAGLKGKVIGGASLSEEHCNFIINLGTATASDIYKLIRLTEQTIYEKFQIKLESEVIPVGEFE